MIGIAKKINYYDDAMSCTILDPRIFHDLTHKSIILYMMMLCHAPENKVKNGIILTHQYYTKIPQETQTATKKIKIKKQLGPNRKPKEPTNSIQAHKTNN
jgi:hypothetical protein